MSLRAIDLFSGAGGLTLGVERAGFKSVLAADSWEPAALTYRLNFPSTRFIETDISEIRGADLLEEAEVDQVDLVVGGPPCQGFSSAGARRESDLRNSLVAEFARIVEEIRPAAVLFENVEGFLTAEGGDRVIDLIDPLVRAGYWVNLRKINAANYGVPQLRKRVILLGGLGSAPAFPEPSHSATGAPGALNGAPSHLPRAPGVGEALDGLPSPDRPGVSDHFAPPLRSSARKRVSALKPGQTMKDLPTELQHSSFRRRAYRRVMDGTPSERRGGAPAGLRRLLYDEPSKAITSACVREFAHPLHDRFLTLREAARLQTFPDDFIFAGTATQKALLVGNAVPPRLAEAMASAIVSWFKKRPRGTESGVAPGRVVSFVPTFASGMSSALASVTERVSNRYGPLQSQNLRLDL
jgi:DNA (cytosine-5)-methyltransferase 1